MTGACPTRTQRFSGSRWWRHFRSAWRLFRRSAKRDPQIGVEVTLLYYCYGLGQSKVILAEVRWNNETSHATLQNLREKLNKVTYIRTHHYSSSDCVSWNSQNNRILMTKIRMILNGKSHYKIKRHLMHSHNCGRHHDKSQTHTHARTHGRPTYFWNSNLSYK